LALEEEATQPAESAPDQSLPVAGLDDKPELQQALLAAIKKVNGRMRTERRAEVARSRDRRLYFRGDQNQAWDEDAGVLRFQVEVEGDEDDGPNRRVFNVFQGYGKSFISTFCQARPKVRAEADDPFNPQQIAAAEQAETYRRIFEKDNDIAAVTMEVARLLWTDDRVVSDTYFDGQREVVELYGVLESRLLITARSHKKSPVIELETEEPTCFVKAKYDDPEVQKKLSSDAGDSYERSARLAVMKQAGTDTEYGVQASDSNGLTTITKSFVRPEAFHELTEVDCKTLLQEFPKGLCVIHNGTTYLESFQCDVDSRIDVLMTMPGDGLSRTSIGEAGMNLQDSYNEFMNLSEETFERGLGRLFIDDSLLNADGLRDQDTSPGSVIEVQLKANETLGNRIYQQPALNPSAQLLEYAENVSGPQMQFALGQPPALFGEAMQDQKTASGYAQAKNQAMGQLSMFWKPFQSWYARIATQAIRWAAAARPADHDITSTLPAQRAGGKPESVRVNPKALIGASFTVEGDDNFPMSWSEKRQNYQALVQLATNNPVLGSLLMHPDNLALGKNLWGLEDFVVPQDDSRNKQLGEIAEMEHGGGPQMNPAMPPQPPQMAGGPQLMAPGTPMPPPPPLVSSVPIDVEYDDHAVEYAEIKRWINSPEGQTAKVQNPDWFQDVRLHGNAHKAQIDAAQAPQIQDKPKVVLNYADLPPAGQVQAAGEAGIQIGPQDIAAKQAQDAAQKQPPMAA
jgi:hypothetical protein